MITFPNAKINIGLDIINRRSDGYHNISTVMVPIPWADILEIVPAKTPETTLTVTGRTVDCPSDKNLVMKAYRALNSVIPLPPLEIHLHKIIPDGAGLGGGSADAAFTLTTINNLLQLGLSTDRMAEIASGIGADCPFFIYNSPMMATGIGTDLTPVNIDLSQYKIIVVKPSVLVPTKEAYAGVTPAMPEKNLADLIHLPTEQWQGYIKNDFEKSIADKHPQIADIKQAMLDSGAVYASMSGSGSAVYGLWKRDNMAELPSNVLQQCAVFQANMN
ncbi:MAG: 4-(cytidine 5'-diphospho)-2-C-methyl-D-erythritol kinase [Paramuribaculum sp.]|nr:4-(cytidine 5'-diphospho)-2-C-methyl-D-erythritol kinase [Paramuribaculum sp.]